MKTLNYLKLTICIMLWMVSLGPLAQNLKEDDYSINGYERIGHINCGSEDSSIALVRVFVSKEFEKDVFSTINLIPLQEYITGFNSLNQLPSGMVRLENNGFGWEPANLGDQSITLFLEIEIDENARDTINLGECKNIQIELPIKRDEPPKPVRNDTVYIAIPVSGSPIKKIYDLTGGRNGESLELFTDDNPLSELEFRLVVNPNELVIENNRLVLSHSGVLPGGIPETITGRIEAKDDAKNRSSLVTCQFKIEPDYGRSECDWISAENNVIDWEVPLTEGEQGIINPFYATNSVDLTDCTIIPTPKPGGPILGPVYSFSDRSFYWTPPYSLVSPRMEMEIVKKTYYFIAQNSKGNGHKELALIVKIRNGEECKENYLTKISPKFENAEKGFINSARKALCYIRAATVEADKKDRFNAQIQNAFNEVNSSFAIQSAGPVAIGVSQGIGLFINVLTSIDNKNSEAVKAYAEALKKQIDSYKNVSLQYSQALALKGKHLSCEDIADLESKAEATLKASENFVTAMAGYRAVANIFGNKKAERIRSTCEI